jgi:hypothetical protein
MPMRPSILILLAAVPAATLHAQADSTKKAAPNNATADSGATRSSWGYGVGAGLLRFPGNAQEQAVSASVSGRFWDLVDISVNPAYVSATAADTVINGRTVKGRSASGLAALPLSIGISHDIAGPWSPSLGVGLGFSLPMGDTTGVGSAQAGVGANLEFGVTPSEAFALSFGVSHALNDAFSSGVGNSSATQLSASSSVKVGSVGVSATYSGDVGAAADGYSPAQSFGGGLSIPLRGDFALTVDGSSGLTNGAPSWSMSMGIGTTPSGLASVMLSPMARVRKAFGAGRKVTRIKPTTRPVTRKPAKP